MRAREKKRRTDDSAVVIMNFADGTTAQRKVKGAAVRNIWSLATAGSPSTGAETVPWRQVAGEHLAYGEAAFAVRANRKRAGLTQTALAAQLGVPQSHISEMERGKRVIGKGLAKRLATVLRVDYRVFL